MNSSSTSRTPSLPASMGNAAAWAQRQTLAIANEDPDGTASLQESANMPGIASPYARDQRLVARVVALE
jgi:hypothetical protein